jgi:hypothetical protein
MKSDKVDRKTWQEKRLTILTTIKEWQTMIAVILTASLLSLQFYGNMQAKRVDANIDFLLKTAKVYREIDFKYTHKNGELEDLTETAAKEIFCTEEKNREARNMLAEFEWMAVGVRRGGLDFNTVMDTRGAYLVDFFNRWRAYMQIRLKSSKINMNDDRRERLYEQFEWLVQEIAEELKSQKLNVFQRFFWFIGVSEQDSGFKPLDRKKAEELFTCPNTNK